MATGFFLEGSAPALPLKISVVREHDPPVKDFQMLNEFIALRLGIKKLD